jgi:GNAT superfamily N-acetyltransferase
MVAYAVEAGLGVDEFKAVLRESGLGERRPVSDAGRLDKMLRGANLIVTARLEGRLVGVARSVTDWSYCLYLSDLAVSRDAQGLGIGRALIERTRAEAGPEVSVLLVAAPGAVTFYEGIGMPRVEAAFHYPRAS